MIAAAGAVSCPGGRLAPAGAPCRLLAPSLPPVAHTSDLQARRASSQRPSTSCRCAAAEQVAPPPHGNAAAAAAGSLGRPSRRKQYDVVALSNLCVDIVVEVPQLPPADEPSRRALLQQLTAAPPPQEQWEVGGNTNFLVAASRLGLRTASVGHLGQDVYGLFMQEVLKAEGVRNIEPVAASSLSAEQDQTLLCFVLVDPEGRHAFCSRYDFGPWPLLSFVRELPPNVLSVLQNTDALFINGFVFDELPVEAVVEAATTARAAGAAVFFDPGPRSWTFAEGPRKAALEAMLDTSDVICMTEDEAAAVTGLQSAEAQARWVLARPGACTEWCIIKMGAEGALLASKTRDAVYTQQALQVDVRDTVGCGDSFAAAVVLGFTREHSIPAVMALASAVGAATAEGLGAGRNVASAERVLSLLQSAVPSCSDGRHQDAVSVLQCSLNSIDLLDD